MNGYEGVDTFMHVYNRTVGSSSELPFGDVEKEAFIRRLKALDRYYAIDVLAVQVMGNHTHAIIHVRTTMAGPHISHSFVARVRRVLAGLAETVVRRWRCVNTLQSGGPAFQPILAVLSALVVGRV